MERLYDACMQIPVRFEKVKEILEKEHYSSESLSAFMIEYISDNCVLETRSYILENTPIPDQHELHCGYLCDLIHLFLEYGLDPNVIHDNRTVLSVAAYANCNHVAADAVKLLLDHGADPNMIIDGESAFDEIDFDVIFGSFEQEDRRMYDAWVHTWLVMIGYGGKPTNGTSPLKMADGYTYQLLRDHKNYDFYIETNRIDPDGWILRVIDKESRNEIGTL